ncbi:MAG: transcriptional regulator [Deltaproteobacteria bacterium]|nr:transcriptional regulator [Deltaproteobacteria bacterium]
MPATIVLTLTGADRIGLVEEITKLLLDLGGNVETSRMARLGGMFAVLMLVSLPAEQLPALERKAEYLIAQGYKVTTSVARPDCEAARPGWISCQIDVQGADHEGIIHQVARHLSQHGINIESLDTLTVPAPISGTPLFTLTGHVAVPPDLSGQDWKVALEEIGRQLDVVIKVTASKES